MTDTLPKAFVIVKTIDGASHLRAMERHGRGEGRNAEKRRVVEDGPRSLAWSVLEPDKMRIVGIGHTGPATAVVGALARHLETHEARLRKNAAPSMHMIVGVSPEYINAGGDPRNPRTNERLGNLLNAARAWADAELGGCYAARIDLDETGTGNVDLFVAPIRANARSKKNFVSCNMAKEQLARRWKMPTKMSYAAMQDSWAQFATKRLGHEFARGTPAEESGRDHIHPDTMKRIGRTAEAKARAELDARIKRSDAALARQKSTITELRRQLAERDKELEPLREAERRGAARPRAREVDR